jgi:hypothetical protein
MIRRPKSVLNLPPKEREIIEVDVDANHVALRVEERVLPVPLPARLARRLPAPFFWGLAPSWCATSPRAPNVVCRSRGSGVKIAHRIAIRYESIVEPGNPSDENAGPARGSA